MSEPSRRSTTSLVTLLLGAAVWVTVGTANPLSAITIQALADLGYSVNAGLAEAYIGPSPALAAAAAGDAPTIDLGNDVHRGPIVEIDGEGNTVRVVPGEDVAQPPAPSGRAAVARIPSPRDPT